MNEAETRAELIDPQLNPVVGVWLMIIFTPVMIR